MDRIQCRAVVTAAIFFATSVALSYQASAISCEITSCRGGGNVPKCWRAMQTEALKKRAGCAQLTIGSGVSSYAMATSLPGVCIKPSAVIKIHRPYRARNYQAVSRGSYWHNFYFGRIRHPAVNYFNLRGGMKRDGYSNASYMIGVPAKNTGVPLCR